MKPFNIIVLVLLSVLAFVMLHFHLHLAMLPFLLVIGLSFAFLLSPFILISKLFQSMEENKRNARAQR